MDYQKLKSNIAENIRIFRLKKRYSQDKLAELANVSQQYICKIEKAQTNPSIQILVDIAEVLDVTVNDLIY